MKAMILAAGLGTRLRPLTDHRPKALVEVGGRTLLEITLSRLRSLGVQEAIVNAHHFADMIAEYLRANRNFGMHIEISREETLLDTGGGLKQAAHFFLDGSRHEEEPFFLHNVDVLSSFDLARMLKFHTEHNALATLAVQHRTSSRYLLFDEKGCLRGRRSRESDAASGSEDLQASVRPEALAFAGIHVVSPRIFARMTEEGPFSIITSYLRLAAEGENLLAFRDDAAYWRDLGKPESVAQAERDLKHQILPS